MARQKREIGKTGIYHILLRGVNNLFLYEEDYTEFSELLKKHIAENKIKVLSYLLLKNRIHLVIDTLGGDVGAKLKPITTSYARYCNRVRNTSGKLFYDRFKSEPIDTKEDLTGVISFINAVSEFEKEGYKYSSLVNPICRPKDFSLTDKQAKSASVKKMYIEDYDCLSKAEISKYIFALCGVYPKDYKFLSNSEKEELLNKLTEKYWISKSKIFEIFGIKKGTVKKQASKVSKPVKQIKKETPKEEKVIPELPKKEEPVKENKPKKKNLSVWLL